MIFAGSAADVRHVVVGGAGPGAGRAAPAGRGRPGRAVRRDPPGSRLAPGGTRERPDHEHRRAGHEPARGAGRRRGGSPPAPRPRWSSTRTWWPGPGPRRGRPPRTRWSTRGAGPCCPGSSTPTPTSSSPGSAARSSPPGWPGQPYQAGGIRSTVAATRDATDDQLRANLRKLAAEMLAQGITTFECKSGYGLTVADEARSVAIAAEFTSEVTYLGAHVVPPEFEADPAGYVDLVCGAMLDACAPRAKWVDVFCERGAFDRDEAAAVLAAGHGGGPAAPGARQPARPGARGAARRAGRRRLRRSLHPPGRCRRRRARLLGHRGHPAARGGVLYPAAVPGRAPAARRRGDRGARHRLQPGLVLQLEHGVVRRAGGARDAHDHRRRPCGRPRRAGPARCAGPTSVISASAPGPTW